jgi:hypothetical protein
MRRLDMVFCQKYSKKLLRTIAAAMLILAAHDLCQTNGQAAIPEQERNALIDLYNSTNGANWTSNTGWLGEPGTECTWQRVQCDKENTSVIELRLWDMNLAGTLPKTLENLTNLERLYISSNELSGTIPATLGNLAKLQSLDLPGNQLKGSIPAELGNLANLQWLDLSENRLSGSIPPSLGNLVNLKDLDLSENRFSGSIPSSLGNLVNLEHLYLTSNELSGAIPFSLGNLIKLPWLDLSKNQLSGEIPSSLENLPNLKGLDFSENQLYGSIPPEVGKLANLTSLNLSSNNLSGSVPLQLGGLIAIRDLNLSYNALYTTDNSLLSFLNSKQADWQKTQTIAPTDISAVAQSSSSILVSWAPIPYVSNTSRYEVYESTTSGGPYAFAGSIHAHSASSLSVTDLKPATTYYFVVRAITYPNGNNRDNTVTSDYSVVAPSRTDAN